MSSRYSAPNESAGILHVHARLCSLGTADVPDAEGKWEALRARLPERPARRGAVLSLTRRPLALAVATLMLGSSAYAAAPTEVRRGLERAWGDITSPLRTRALDTSSPARAQRAHPSGRGPASHAPFTGSTDDVQQQPATVDGAPGHPDFYVRDVGAALPSIQRGVPPPTGVDARERSGGQRSGREADERPSGTPEPEDAQEPAESKARNDDRSGRGSGLERDDSSGPGPGIETDEADDSSGSGDVEDPEEPGSEGSAPEDEAAADAESEPIVEEESSGSTEEDPSAVGDEEGDSSENAEGAAPG